MSREVTSTGSGEEHSLAPVNGARWPSPHPQPIYLPPLPHYDDDTDASATLNFVLRAIGHWWKVAVPAAVLIAAVAGGAIWYTFKPVYRASAWVRISSRSPYIAYQSQEDLGQSQQFVQTQVELLKSTLVLGPVVARPEIARLPEVSGVEGAMNVIKGKLRVAQIGMSELYEVNYDALDPQASATIVNAVVEEYFNLRSQDEATQSRRVLELLDEEKQRRAREVQRLRDSLRKLSTASMTTDPLLGTTPVNRVAGNHPLLQVQNQLANAEVETKLLEARVKAAEEIVARQSVGVPELFVEQELDRSPEIQDAREALALLRYKLRTVEATAAQGTKDPAYARLEADIARQEEALRQMRESLRPEAERRLQSLGILQQRDQLAQLQANLESARLLEAMYRERYEAMLKDADQSGDHTLEREFLNAELAREERVFDIIAQRATALQTEMRAPGRVTLMKRAEPPLAPVEAVPWKYLSAAVLGSVCVPFGLVLVWEWRVRRISNSQQLELQGILPVVAEIAKLPNRVPTRGRGHLSQGSAGRALALVEESVDSLRTSLVLPDARKNAQVLAVASAVHGEGKTTIASQLAVSIARSTGERTLLIDADMRSPDVHHVFQIPLEPGLCKVLDGRCSLEEAIVTSWSDHVHLLPAGLLHKSPHFLVGKGSFEALLQELRSRYRYIVVDTPPVLSASESLVVAKCVDEVIICAMSGRSRENQVRLAHSRLVAAGIRPVGGVLSAVDVHHYASTYGSYAYTTHPTRE